MKLLALIVRHFHSVQIKTSAQQLLEDFAEFPPKPLCSENLKGDFKVVRTHAIGTIYQDFLLVKGFFSAIVSGTRLSANMMNYPGMSESALNMKSSMDDLIAKGFPAYGMRAIVSITLPFAFMFMIANGKRIRPSGPGILGFFIPVVKNEMQICILSGVIRKHKKHEDSIISHEHLHLLQYKNSEYHSKGVKSPQKFLKEVALSNAPLLKHLLYVMDKHETEARLHECVLSFYRAHRHIPLTISGFLGLLASSKDCGEEYTAVLKLMNAKLKNNKLTGVAFDKFGEYSDRDSSLTGQLQLITTYANSHELQYRFITEVLSVMYGNLLKYYGDLDASKSFLEGIARPNFYDELYYVQPTQSSPTVDSSVQQV